MSVHLETERFRHALAQIGLPSMDIQNVCDALDSDIEEVLLDVVSSAVSEAIDFALQIGATDFVDDVQVLPDANGLYQISTHSGNLDYSIDAQEMLPHLLKNADVSADGHRYKIIPMQKKEKQVERSMFSMLQTRQDAIDDARAILRKQANNKKLGIAEALRINLSKQVSAAHTTSKRPSVQTGEVQFRTASDRQDPHTQWVIPEKSADMTDYVRELNQRIVNQADAAIMGLINSYYAAYTE